VGGAHNLFLLYLFIFSMKLFEWCITKRNSNFWHSTRRKFAFCTFKTNLLKLFSLDTFIISKKVVGLRLWDKRVMKKIGRLGCYCMAPNFDLMIGSTKL